MGEAYGWGVKKSLGETVSGGISIVLGPFQYTRNGREPNFRQGEGEVLGVG